MGARTPGEAAAAVARAFENAGRVSSVDVASRFSRFRGKGRPVVVGTTNGTNLTPWVAVSSPNGGLNFQSPPISKSDTAVCTFASENGHHVGLMQYHPSAALTATGAMAPALEKARTAFERYTESHEQSSSRGSDSIETSRNARTPNLSPFGVNAPDNQNVLGTASSTRHGDDNSEDGGIFVDTNHRLPFGDARARFVGSSDLALWDFELGGRIVNKNQDKNNAVTLNAPTQPFPFVGIHIDGWGDRTLEFVQTSNEQVVVEPIGRSGSYSTSRNRNSWIATLDMRNIFDGPRGWPLSAEAVDVTEKTRVDVRPTATTTDATVSQNGENNSKETRDVLTKTRLAYKSSYNWLPLLRFFPFPSGNAFRERARGLSMDDRVTVERRRVRGAWEPPGERGVDTKVTDSKVSDIAEVRVAADVSSFASSSVTVSSKYVVTVLNGSRNHETTYAVAHEGQLGMRNAISAPSLVRKSKLSLECERVWRGETNEKGESKKGSVSVKTEFDFCRHPQTFPVPKITLRCVKAVPFLSPSASPWHVCLSASAFGKRDDGCVTVCPYAVVLGARREFCESKEPNEKEKQAFVEVEVLFTRGDARAFAEIKSE